MLDSDQRIHEFETRRKYLSSCNLERSLTICAEIGANLISFNTHPSDNSQHSDDKKHTTSSNFLITSSEVFTSSLEMFLLMYYSTPDPSPLLDEIPISLDSLHSQFPRLGQPTSPNVPIQLLGPLHQLARLAFDSNLPLAVRLSIVETLECVSTVCLSSTPGSVVVDRTVFCCTRSFIRIPNSRPFGFGSRTLYCWCPICMCPNEGI